LEGVLSLEKPRAKCNFGKGTFVAAAKKSGIFREGEKGSSSIGKRIGMNGGKKVKDGFRRMRSREKKNAGKQVQYKGKEILLESYE